VGLQAKYFTRTADIGWTQIRDSFLTALADHPTLTTYRIYLACDLTGPTGRSTRTGTERWAELQQEMEAHARTINRSVDVSLVTASDILGEIARAECVGLSDQWFGALEITRTRLTNWLDATIDALGDRYHPEDHVEVGAQQVARVLSRSPVSPQSFGNTLLPFPPWSLCRRRSYGRETRRLSRRSRKPKPRGASYLRSMRI
jgi:hypothetical protein